jgi:hypothetical protein
MLSCIPSMTKRFLAPGWFFNWCRGAGPWRENLEVSLHCSGLGYDTVQSYVNLGGRGKGTVIAVKISNFVILTLVLG